MEEQGRKHGRLVLVPSPFQGHINPMLQLAAILHREGFSITIVHTELNSPNPSNHPDYNFKLIKDGLSAQDISALDITKLVLVINDKCQAPFHECLVMLLQQQQQKETNDDDKIAGIIYDELSYFAEPPARDLKLPSIIFRTSNVITFLVRGFFPQLRAEGLIPLPDSLAEEHLPEHPPLRLKDLPISLFGPVENFFKLISNARNLGTSSAIIYNTMDCLEGPSLEKLRQQLKVPVFAVGPIHKIAPAPSSSFLEEDTWCMSWLDQQRPNSVLYISLGSLASTDEKELNEMAWGLADSNQPFLWVLRPGSIHGANRQSLPDGFLKGIGDRGRIVKWAPQRKVLAHGAVAAFWSHCGWNSTLESLCEGVPMICRPSFGDQKVTARYVSHVWRVGLQLENPLERGEVERAVRKVIVEEEGEEMRRRAERLKREAEVCIMEGGSSYKSVKDLVAFIRSFQFQHP